MNKYLLLRDNKQTGPYTVPEIIEMGIKPYDLVWLEGKSAAWRYPSEVEELKAYAPTVEEQPFDRFYKKPDQKKTATPVTPTSAIDEVPVVDAVVPESRKEINTAPAQQENHKRYLPAAESSDEKPGRKVYINFPAASNPSKVAADQAASNTIAKQPSSPASVPQAVASPVSDGYHDDAQTIAESWQEKRKSAVKTAGNFSTITETSRTRKSDSRILQVVIAACVLLGLLTGVLLFNYFRQRQALNELNVLVQQIENNKKQEAAVAAAIIQQTTAPAEAVSPVTEVNTDKAEASQQLASIDYSKPEKPVSPAIAKKQPAPAAEEEAVTFTENKQSGTGRPVARREDPAASDNAADNSEKLPSTENLFKLVEVAPNEYKTGLLGGISNLKFELKNKSAIELHRVAVEVKYLGPEKKVVKKQMIYFENVSPGGQSTIDVPKSNRGVTIEYTVTDIKS